MKTQKVYKTLLVLALCGLPFLTIAKESDNEQTKEIIEKFDVNDNSNVYFKHRRGTLKVEYIQGDQGRVEATVRIKGDDLEDIQTLMDAMSIEVTRDRGFIELKTANKVVSWSSNSGLWGKRHKIVLSNGKVITSKIDDITVHATLYLPKVNKLELNNRYDDIVIHSYQAKKLDVDIHSAELKAGDLLSDAHIKIKYGKLDVKNAKDLSIDSHDSEGEVENVGALTLKDKYSELEFGNLKSLDADLHDSDIELLSVSEDANIKDKYSEIKLKNMYNGVWDLHDSKVIAENVFKINVKTKYSDITLDKAIEIEMDCHDDNLRAEIVESLILTKSKYTTVKIDKLEKALTAKDSHDDTIDIRS